MVLLVAVLADHAQGGLADTHALVVLTERGDTVRQSVVLRVHSQVVVKGLEVILYLGLFLVGQRKVVLSEQILNSRIPSELCDGVILEPCGGGLALDCVVEYGHLSGSGLVAQLLLDLTCSFIVSIHSNVEEVHSVRDLDSVYGADISAVGAAAHGSGAHDSKGRCRELLHLV